MKADSVNYQPGVELVKAALVAKGVNLSGPCGAFEITKRVAWMYRSEGAGLLEKSSGNNCQGYAVDVVMFPDGSHADCLTDSGGSNGPTWRTKNDDGTPLWADPSRWRAPVDPGDTPEPGTNVPETGTSEAVAKLQQQVAGLSAKVGQLEARVADLEQRPVAQPCTVSVQRISTSRSWGHAHEVAVPVCQGAK